MTLNVDSAHFVRLKPLYQPHVLEWKHEPVVLQPQRFHLGDIINMLQLYHRHAAFIYAGIPESPDQYTRDILHGATAKSVRDSIAFGLTLLDTQLQLTEEVQADMYPIAPWMGLLPCPDYELAKNLPADRDGPPCVSFDARSSTLKEPPPHWIREIIRRYPDALNLGDKPLVGTRDFTQAGLADKFEAVARAPFFIGIDNGIMHLALMTRTPCYGLPAASTPAWQHYPYSRRDIWIDDLSQLP